MKLNKIIQKYEIRQRAIITQLVHRDNPRMQTKLSAVTEFLKDLRKLKGVI